MRVFLNGICLTLALLLMPTVVNAQTVHVELYGLKGPELKNASDQLHASMQTYEGKVNRYSIHRYMYRLVKDIKLALEPFGYFHAHAEGFIHRTNGVWLIRIYIVPGPPVIIKQVSVKVSGPGVNNQKINKFMQNFPIKTDTILNIQVYNDVKKQLFKIASNEGYIMATFDNKININPRTNIALINFHLLTGPRYYFGTFYFTTKLYAPEFLKRFINFCPNEPFSSLKLLELQQQMENSYFFNYVNIHPQFRETENYRVPILINSRSPKAQKYTFGVGYSTFSGPRITGGVSLRRLNRYGHHFEAQMSLSQILSGISTIYYIPGRNPLTDQYLIGAKYKKFIPKSGKSESLTLFVGYETKYKKITFNTNLNYLFERFYIKPAPYRYANELYPNLRISYVNADNLVDPKFGMALNLNLQGTAQQLLSSNSFFQTLANAKFVLSPWTVSRFILRGSFGYTATNHLKRFPMSLRYFAGGINSIRGFAESSIGPGKYLKIASIEYQHKIINNWRAAVFYDVGTAANSLNAPLNRGAGVGVVYDSRLGPVKVYLARAVSKKTEPYSVELSVGQELV